MSAVVLFLMWGVVIFILNNKGSTLIESMLAFSIFISICILYLSFHTTILNKNSDINQRYVEYQQSQSDKEKQLWIEKDLYSVIETVLH